MCGTRQWAVLEQAGRVGEVTPSFFVVVQSLRSVQLFVTWTAALQASLSFTISQSLLKLMSIESVMPTLSHLFHLFSQLSHLLSSPSPDFNLSQYQGLF